MPASPKDLLGYTALMKPVQTVLNGIPRLLPAGFWDVKDETLGDTARHVEYQGTRKVARVQAYGSPPRQVIKMPMGVRDVKLLHSVETQAYRSEMLVWLQQWTGYVPQQKAFKDELARQGEAFAVRQANLRTAAITATLGTSVMYFDPDGNMLPDATGADLVLDQGVDAANKGDCGGIVTAPWSAIGTDIPTQVAALKKRSLQTTGQELKYAFYSTNVLGYITRNTSMQAYLARNPVINQQLMDTNTLPKGLLGLDWVDVQAAFFEDPTGIIRDQFPADQITFTPEVNESWYTLVEGTTPVPTRFGLASTVDEALAMIEHKAGMFRFASLSPTYPMTLNDTHGDTFIPLLRNKKAIYLLDTTP